jgi:putative endonuclease
VKAQRTPAQLAGGTAEDLAADFLVRQGLAIVARNYRTRMGEIDLIAQHGATLVFVEVRLRKGSRFGNALASITPAKRGRLVVAAKHYLMKLGREPFCRFDVIAIDEAGTVEWLRGAFDAG